MVDFLFAIIELFSLALMFRCYEQILVEIDIFQRRVGHFKRKFQVERDIAHQTRLVSKN